MKRTIKLAGALAAATALVAAAETASAGCSNPGTSNSAAVHMIPGFIVADLAPKISLPPPGPNTLAQGIVGTWLVTYTAGGKPFAQALTQWHNDGTEWENINLPLAGGSMCLGSWKAVDARDVIRFHVGWLFTAGLLTGYFTETEKDKLTGTNTYSGVYDQKIFDLAGHVLAEIPGTSNAVRIGP
jgi:hypothetical protein